MDKERVMAKIRKCLALSKSANEHEAASALRQAHALMKKHDLSSSDASVFELCKSEGQAYHKRPPKWACMLYTAIGEAFGCTVFTQYQKVIFVGSGAGPELALYSYDVLYRQLENARKLRIDALKNSAVYISPQELKRRGQAFCEGWVTGVFRKIREFAAATTEEQQKKHTEFMQMQVNAKIKESKERKSAIDRTTRGEYFAGADASKNVQLNAGVGAGEKPTMLGRG